MSTKFQNTRRARAAVNRQGYFLICCLILKESCSYSNYPVANLSRRPGYRQITGNTAFGRFEAGERAADVLPGFGCYARLIYRLQTCFRQSGSKYDKPPQERPRITTPLELRVTVTST